MNDEPKDKLEELPFPFDDEGMEFFKLMLQWNKEEDEAERNSRRTEN